MPIGDESSFWYEKEFHVMNNETKDGLIAVNFNCFNNIFVYDFRSCEFKLYVNQMTSGVQSWIIIALIKFNKYK